MKLNTYVNFAGKCAEAFRFYEQHLRGHIGMMMTHGEGTPSSPSIGITTPMLVAYARPVYTAEARRERFNGY